jgi:chromosomal replication initiator protein
MKPGIHIFEQALKNLKERIAPNNFNIWFKPIEFKSFENNTLEIFVPNRFFKEFFQNHYGPHLLSEIARLSGSPTMPNLVIIEKPDEGYAKEVATPVRQEIIPASHPSLNPKYTFDRFIVGKSNELAYYSARSVAENPAKKYNPLVIYGKSGLGKTHLLNAIGHLFFQKFKDKNLIFISSEQLMNEFIYATKSDNMIKFREKYRKNCDLLLLDDIQFIGGNKGATQDEIFNTINTLLERKKQIVIVSNVHPSKIEGLDEKLTSRITWGLTCEIKPPELEVRKNILEFKAKLMGLKLSEEIIDFIASSIKSNVRELESALNHIEAFSSLTKHKIDLNLVKEALKDFFRVEKNRITPETIIESVAKYYNLDKGVILSSTRTRNVSLARHISMYLIRKYINLSLNEIGSLFNGKNHSVVLLSIKKIENSIEKDEKIKNDIQAIEGILTSL